MPLSGSRHAALFALLTLASACSAPTAARDTDAPDFDTTAASLGRDPVQGGGAGPRSSPHPHFHAMLRGSLGSFEQETSGTAQLPGLDDHAGAARYEVVFEGVGSAVGGGIQIGITGVDDDLHEGTAGITDVDTTSFDIFPHFTGRPRGGDIFRMPIRVGPYLSVTGQDLSFNAGSDLEIAYISVGIRLEIEPEIDVLQRDNLALSLFAGGRGGIGAGTVALDVNTDDETFSTTEYHVGVRGGVRFRIGVFNAESGYVWQHQTFEESDSEILAGTSTVIPETEFSFTGFFFSAGVRW